jgi:hypothetical protein
MLFPRRCFLGSSLFSLVTALTDALATPLWKWKHRLVLEPVAADPEQSPVQFVDVAQLAGLKVPNYGVALTTSGRSLRPREVESPFSTTTTMAGLMSMAGRNQLLQLALALADKTL